MPDPDVRRAEIADAAITVAGTAGMRGLTHRAVDVRAGLPTGSTSYYFRTRAALLQAAVRRLAELDRELFRPGDDFAGSIAAALDDSLSRHRIRTTARYLFLLEAARDPDLTSIREVGREFREYAAEMLASADVPEPRLRANTLVAALDGLVFDRLANTGGLTAPKPGTPASRADLRRAVELLLQIAQR
ncbi:MAG TPA: TetR family transcriptional regulator [Mycobacteriales bacterium]|nr:TetR family transcriptional regulator [Mycobacteriales bacterium]